MATKEGMIQLFGKTCKHCGKRFLPNNGNQKYCSASCKHIMMNRKARRGMRGFRLLKLNGQLKDKSCQVCGYADTIDLHHEGEETYILCPNHHALITRGIKGIEEYKIQPIKLADTVKHKR